MSNYCPEWIFGICCANTSKEFLSSNNSIAAISKKYSTTLSEKYNEIRFEEILDLSENILQFLSDINSCFKCCCNCHIFISLECDTNEDCSGASDTCISNSCHCGSKAKCERRADTCTEGICKCGGNDECPVDEFCFLGKCQGM